MPLPPDKFKILFPLISRVGLDIYTIAAAWQGSIDRKNRFLLTPFIHSPILNLEKKWIFMLCNRNPPSLRNE